ncbi:potassium transporter [Solibacillus isronensis]|uniref:potassium transporter n=1 Tax=Solibacillus isronensis TaxID=412383 RepID=UPI0009A6DA71|nr:potassium transporter [Solibacillus isronensis]
MNSISSSKNGTLLIVIALAMALLFAMYYYIVKPKQDEEQMIRSEINSLHNEIAVLEETIATDQSQQSETNANEFALRKKVPDNREIDELILSIEEIQYITDSRIQSIEFNNYNALVSSSGLQDPLSVPETEEGTATESTESADQTEDAEVSEELPVSTIAVETLPPSLKFVTFNINVAAPNDVNLLQFIEEIENKERVMRIDIINFALPGEEDKFTEEASEIVTADIQVTTFYYE